MIATTVKADRRAVKNHMRTRNHVHARGDHGGGVDQSGDRRGAFHGVGQPDVKRNLGRFAASPDQQQQADGGQQPGSGSFDGQTCRILCDGTKHLPKIQRSEMSNHEKQRDQKPEIADAVDDERLFARRCGRILGEPESDQQIGRKAHAFPADKHQQVVAGQHQRQHEEHEQI